MSFKGVFRRDVTESSATESDLGTVGELRYETDGRTYRLVKAGAAVADGQLVQLDSVSGSTGYTVEGVHLRETPVFGVNQMGQSVAAAGYFFCLVKGTANVRSADFGTDVSCDLVDQIFLNSDDRLESVDTDAQSTILDLPAVGQCLVSRASDATAVQPIYIVGMGA